MNIDDITTTGFILALFIRSDGERFLLGDGDYTFTQKQLLFTAAIMSNDVVQLQGANGSMLAGQVRRPSTQSFDGFIGDGTSSRNDIEIARRKFISFFQQNYSYTVVYLDCNGNASQQKLGYIVDTPEVKELYQIQPNYHVALAFEDVNYYEYAEDEEGNEKYASMAMIPLTGDRYGGLIWDNDGVVWDNDGATWEAGTDGSQVVLNLNIVGETPVVWTIPGPVTNPQLSNTGTGDTLLYTGIVGATETLVINTLEETAYISGSDRSANVSGDWLRLGPGINRISYLADSSGAPASELQWQGVIG